MDALHFLIGRKWLSGRDTGLALMAATLMVWMSFQLMELLPKPLPLDGLPGLVCMLIAMGVGIMSVATASFVLAIVPLYALQRLGGTLQTWIRQRRIEEMLSTGMTGRAILDAAAVYGLRWWMQASLPSLLLCLVLFPATRDLALWRAVLTFMAVGVGVAYFALSLLTWSLFPGGRALLPALVPMAAVPVLSFTTLVVASHAVDGVWRHYPADLTLGVTSFVAVLAGRWLAIYGLENWERLSRVDGKTRRAIRRRLPSTRMSLSENPICAREGMRGIDAGEWGARLLMVGVFLLVSFTAGSGGGLWGFVGLLTLTVLTNSYRGAQRMSQIVTQESEACTLETVRSTPMTSEQFLYGWMRVVVLPQWAAHTVLLAAVAAVTVGLGQGALLLSNSAVLAVCLSYALPLIGAYIGASIAGQAKTRSEIGGQLMAAFAATVVLGGPQALAGAQMASLPAALFGLSVMTGGACWVLDAGARKSLNRILLPQR